VSDITPESTLTVWVGESDVDDVERFDAHFETRPGKYSRSDEIKRAMSLHLSVQEALDRVDADLSPREVESLVRQAILDEFR
jgi:hypothetical protein